MSNEKRRGGWNNPASADNGRAGGRPPARAEVREGDGLFITHVYPDGVAELGRGRVRVERVNRSDRVIIIPQADGSEIRILVVRN